jgi:hypothetical protein
MNFHTEKPDHRHRRLLRARRERPHRRSDEQCDEIASMPFGIATALPIVGRLSNVLRYRQQGLLACLGSEGDGIRGASCVAATAKARHRLHELRG